MKKQIKKAFSKVIRTAISSVTGDLSQELNKQYTVNSLETGIEKLLRKSGAEGCVLLKNENTLPFTKEDKVAVFGRCQYNYFCVGYGSGGDVISPYKVNLLDGMRNDKICIHEGLANFYERWCIMPDNVPDEGYWGNWPMSYEEMPLKKDQVILTSLECNKALVVIGRAAGEDRENKLKKGSYYLTDVEKENLNLICSRFNKVTVVLDCGNLIDMSWVEDYKNITAVILAGQGGQESGNAVADVLCGKVNPCGKLTDTIAKKFKDYPSSANFGKAEYNNYEEDIYVGYRYFESFAKDKVLYPFGFGLSYTNFEFKNNKFKYKDNKVQIEVNVKNIGCLKGKEVVQVYVEAPSGVLGKAVRSLVQFDKTKELKPDESQVFKFNIDEYDFSSYDDDGKTGNKSCYVLEKGKYNFYVGASVRADNLVGSFELAEDKVVEKLTEACSVNNPFVRLCSYDKNGEVIKDCDMTPFPSVNLERRIFDDLPYEIGYKGVNGFKLRDVKDGKITLDEFISQLNNIELEALTRGGGAMDSPYGVSGNAGAYGGIIDSLNNKFGIPAVITSDGPSGVRCKRTTPLLPCGTTLAQTWNKKLVEDLFSKQAEELEYFDVDVLLAPGMNIHRNPLCGRNFEYYSEDPRLSGEIASATVKGIQCKGRSACPKHFACNNQEVKRNTNDSRVSERALREIYLKGFEIVVKKAKPMNIMTSYNKINSVWSHYNYDLVTTILRKEWGYDGVVITDWWMQKAKSPEFPLVRDNAYRVRSQVDVLMPGNMGRTKSKYVSDGTLLENVNKYGGITRGEIERSAKNVLNFVLKRMD